MRPFSPKGGVLYWIRSSVSTFAALRILPGKEGVHVGEEAAGLARLRLPARRQRRAAQVDAVDQLGRQVVEEAAGIFPDPPPASTSTGPSVWSTAARCWRFSRDRSSGIGGAALYHSPPDSAAVFRYFPS